MVTRISVNGGIASPLQRPVILYLVHEDRNAANNYEACRWSRREEEEEQKDRGWLEQR